MHLQLRYPNHSCSQHSSQQSIRPPKPTNQLQETKNEAKHKKIERCAVRKSDESNTGLQ